MNLAIVAWFFPPTGGAGAQRPLHIARAIRASGDSVTVVAPSLPEGIWSPDDPSLGDALEGLEVRRCAPHGGKSTPGAADQFRDFVRAEIESLRPDAVLITMSPFWLANTIESIQSTGAKAILDLRDPWALDSWPGYRTWWDWRREARTMHGALRRADGFIMNTPDALAAVIARWPRLERTAHTVVPNGWLGADFPPLESVELQSRRGPASPFRIVHSGTLHDDGASSLRSRLKRFLRYEPQRLIRSGRGPKHLLEAVSALRSDGLDVQVDFIGTSSDRVRAAIDSMGCGDFVNMTGYLRHDLAVERIREADALFLPLGGIPDGTRSLIVPGKTYEYLAAGPPVVAALPAGDARDLAGMSDRVFLCEPCDAESIGQAIRGALEWWTRAPEDRSMEVEGFLRGYERGMLAERVRDFVASVLDSDRDVRG